MIGVLVLCLGLGGVSSAHAGNQKSYVNEESYETIDARWDWHHLGQTEEGDFYSARAQSLSEEIDGKLYWADAIKFESNDQPNWISAFVVAQSDCEKGQGELLAVGAVSENNEKLTVSESMSFDFRRRAQAVDGVAMYLCGVED